MIRNFLKRLSKAYYFSQINTSDQFVQMYFKNRNSLQEHYTTDLNEQYQIYTRTISTPNMAASLELCSFLLALCQENKFEKLLDMGSGFTSFVLRQYQHNSDKNIEVYSVDDDEEWLQKTKNYLTEKRLPTTNVLSLKKIYDSNVKEFDLIVHDLNFVEERIKHVEKVVELIKPNGTIIFDDVHKMDYCLELLKKLKKYPGTIYNLEPITRDQFNRFSLAFVKR